MSSEIPIIDNTPTVTFLLIGPGGELVIRHLQLLSGKKIPNLIIIMVHKISHDWILIDITVLWVKNIVKVKHVKIHG